MMIAGFLLCGLVAVAQEGAFWNSKEPADWTIEEVSKLLEHSPWATTSKASRAQPIRMHLATAAPMKEAEKRERQAQRRRSVGGPNFEEYQSMIADGKYIALAVLLPDEKAVADAAEARNLERDSVLYVGKRSYRLVTTFPPTDGDPYLRYIFPRDVRPGDKSLLFEIYIPGGLYPERHLEFDLKSMVYRGKVEY